MSEVADPPALVGFEVVDLLGSGGYADVFLYEQQMPRRRVAVKVLREQGLTDSGRTQFTAEANLMAALSAHPYIVTIFNADVAKDGRPYLVMEYYPGVNLSVRCRQKPLGVSEVLRIGVQLAGAVETAHRSGIVHRDLKPANVLTSAFGKPGLTDFGISAVTTDQSDSAGLSVPWSPPELLTDSADADESSDVYGLAATIYTLLAGRSPFERPGGDNSTLALMARIEHDPVPPTQRSEVPASLDRVLAGAMSKSRANRPRSASDLAHSLQSIERELRLQPTDLDIPAIDTETALKPVAVEIEADRTRFRGAQAIIAQPVQDPPPPIPNTAGNLATNPASDRTTRRSSGTDAGDRTMHRAAPLRPPGPDPGAPSARPPAPTPTAAAQAQHRAASASPPKARSVSGRSLAVGLVILVAIAALGALALRVLGTGSAGSQDATKTSNSVDFNGPGEAGVVDAPGDPTVTGPANAPVGAFAPAPQAQVGDSYVVTFDTGRSVLVAVTTDGAKQGATPTFRPAQTVSLHLPAGVVCVTVVHQRAGAVSSPPVRGCRAP